MAWRFLTARRRASMARWRWLRPFLLLRAPLLHLLRLLLVLLLHLLLSCSICVLLLQSLVLLLLLLLKPLMFLLLLVIDLFLLLLQSLVLLWIAGIGRSRALVRRNITRVDWRRRPRDIVLRPSIVFGTRRIVLRPAGVVFGARRIILRPGARVGIGTTSVSRLRCGRVGIATRRPTIRRWIVRRASFSCRNRRLESCWPRRRRHRRAPTIDRRSQVCVRTCRLHLW
jgi:hypothetical protein